MIHLNLEKAFKAFLPAQTVSPIAGLTGDQYFAAHEKAKIAPTGTYIGIIAEAPDWQEMVINAIVKVHLEIATAGIQDHDNAPQLSIDHAARVGAVIALLCDQNFGATLAALNIPGAGPDTRPWKGLGFTGWQAEPPEPDGTSQDGTQLITRLPYTFEVFWE